MNHCARSLMHLYIFLWIPFAAVPLSSGSFIFTRTDGQLQLSLTIHKWHQPSPISDPFFIV